MKEKSIKAQTNVPIDHVFTHTDLLIMCVHAYMRVALSVCMCAFSSGQFEMEAIELCSYVQKNIVDCIQCNNVRNNRICV